MDTLAGIIYTVFAVATGIIGIEIHGSMLWAVMDFFFAPLAWIKWLLCHEVNITIIKNAFEFFLQ